MIYDESGNPINYLFLAANKSYQKLTGVNPNGKLVTEAFPGIENDPFNWIGTFGEVAKMGKEIRFQQYLQPNDRWYDCVGYQYKPDHFVAAFLEITEQKRTEIKLNENQIQLQIAKEKAEKSEKHYRILVETMPDGVYKSTHAGKFVKTNPAMVKMLGYNSEEELLAVDIKNDLYIDDSERDNISLNELNQELGIFQLRKKDGSVIWVEDHGWYSFDESGEITYHEGVMRDVTERIQKEQELIETKEKANRNIEMVLNSQSLAHICSYSTNLNETDLEKSSWVCSPELYKIFGIDEMYPHTIAGWAGFIHPDHREELVAYHEYVVKNRTSFSHEYKIIRINDGVERWVQGTGELVYDEQGEPVRMHGAIQDITELKKTEDELIKAKEHAEESDRLKSAFLANMSHEIRTPMNGILGFAELLKEPELTGEKQQEYIRIIEKSGTRMLNIINDIVDISKVEAGLMKMDIKETNINEQIEYIYTFFKPEVEGKGMQLSFSNSLPSREVTLKTDREKVYAILANLVKNAIKYSEKGSIEFGYVKKAGFLEFYVKDTGIGIPKDRQEAIFERFIQADIADKMARQGAGLGLSISKAHVEMLGGKIWVESDEGNLPAGKAGGSIFYFTLPYQTEPEEKIVAKNDDGYEKSGSKANSEVSGLNILVVEDDETSEMLLSALVKEHTTTVLKASTGIEAVDICRNNPDLDLILMDIQMPGLNGYEATRQIRQFNKDVIIIAQTAFGLSGDKEKAIEAGCNDYISKPINKDKLLALIQKYFKK
jgi:PAS domain S-box-containing protein